MQRMRLAALDGAAGGDQRLADHLAAEDALPADLRAVAAEQVDLEPLEIEDLKEVVDGAGHAEGLASDGAACGRALAAPSRFPAADRPARQVARRSFAVASVPRSDPG